MTALLVVTVDRPSAWIAKGEVVDRYYNPDDVFDDVHLLLLNDDRPPPGALRRLVGRASVHVHNVPAGPAVFARSLGWRPRLLGAALRGAIDTGCRVRADVVRTYGPGIDAFVAREVARRTAHPYLVSVHVNPDEDLRRRDRRIGGWKAGLAARASGAVERLVLRDADLVMPVYESIVPYLRRCGVERYEVVYNVINARGLQPKHDYGLHRPARLLSVGRQVAAKDPTPIIRALVERPDAVLTVIGDGPYHDRLVVVAKDHDLADRVTFRRSVANDELMSMLVEQDLVVLHTEYWELSKVMLETLLTGVPLVVNRRHGEAVPELTSEICRLVDGSAHGYASALRALLSDVKERASLGRRALDVATTRWSPRVTEQRHADVYRHFLGSEVRRA
jgi:glycosyltransferase involved in cell wall biosynthesis